MLICIKENSFIARVAALFLHENRMAITIGKTIYLWKASREDFLKNEKWLQHELVHIQQFHRHGFSKFLFLYLWQLIKNGYGNNKFEIEARAKEDNPVIPHHIRTCCTAEKLLL
jgi:hypothetical protein